jgi:hypothetical protein
MGALTGMMSDGRGKGEGRFIIGRKLNLDCLTKGDIRYLMVR